MDRIMAGARRVIAVVATVALAVALGASPAQAGRTIYSDDFESCCNWTYFNSDGSAWSFWLSRPSLAYNGSGLSVLHAPTNTDGWAEVGRTFEPLTPRTCSATAFVNPIGTSTLTFEIIDPDTWSSIAFALFNISGNSYRQIRVGPWLNTKGDIYLRIALLGGLQKFTYVDKFALDCAG